jgi:hypothetical protein
MGILVALVVGGLLVWLVSVLKRDRIREEEAYHRLQPDRGEISVVRGGRPELSVVIVDLSDAEFVDVVRVDFATMRADRRMVILTYMGD